MEYYSAMKMNKNWVICTCLLVAQMVKNPPAMQEMQVWSLGWEDPLEKGMAITEKNTNNKFGEGVEKKEPSYTVDGNVNWCNHCGKQYGSALEN